MEHAKVKIFEERGPCTIKEGRYKECKDVRQLVLI